jgi:hypothetical protein
MALIKNILYQVKNNLEHELKARIISVLAGLDNLIITPSNRLVLCQVKKALPHNLALQR